MPLEKIKISSREEYDYARGRGYEPLRDRRFDIEHNLRIEIQRDLFGRGNKEENNIKFYHYAWDISRIRVCENCGRPLDGYSSIHISHILSRGANPHLAYDLRNFNLLCYECHQTWENPLTRKGMRIYNKNEETINLLKKEYDTGNN